jgi:hypothetical protein
MDHRILTSYQINELGKASTWQKSIATRVYNSVNKPSLWLQYSLKPDIHLYNINTASRINGNFYIYLTVISDMGFYKWFATGHAPCDEEF